MSIESKQVILITGAREWSNESVMRDALNRWKDLGKQVFLIHGECRGADNMAGEISDEYGFTVLSKPAEWNKYGRAAGPIRNAEMVKQAASFKTRGIPTIVLAFHDNLEESKGTKNCVNLAKKTGLQVEIWTSKNNE